jgi:hypothetical protein
MAKIEMLESSESENEDSKNQDNVATERERRKLERITKKKDSRINRPENKTLYDMSHNELTALELHKRYKTDKEKWVNSYRGFPFNVSMMSLVATLALTPLLMGFLFLPLKDMKVWRTVGISLFLSVLSYYICVRLIPELKGYMIEHGITGKDLNKTGTMESKPKIPEAMGIITSVIFLLNSIVMVSILDFDKDKLLLFMTGLLCISLMILLGFIDDVVALKWKYKLILPLIASFALLLVYDGKTSVIMPIPTRFIFGEVLELGIFYKMFFVLLMIF